MLVQGCFLIRIFMTFDLKSPRYFAPHFKTKTVKILRGLFVVNFSPLELRASISKPRLLLLLKNQPLLQKVLWFPNTTRLRQAQH